jgi:hypothetical protein
LKFVREQFFLAAAAQNIKDWCGSSTNRQHLAEVRGKLDGSDDRCQRRHSDHGLFRQPRLLRQLLTEWRRIPTANMLILKRLAVWILERLAEGCLLGALLAYLCHLLVPEFTVLFARVLASAAVVGLVLFVHGYYLTTACFGVVWRSSKSWLYPAITAALFVIHSHIVFLRGNHHFTQEARAMEFPFVLCGACIAFGCAFMGNRVLNKRSAATASTNPFLSATGITLLVFLLANVAHSLPAAYDNGFRTYGIPFHFYREGGFVDGWVWHRGGLLWHRIVADTALVAGVVVLLGKAWQRINTARAR